jgi:two-component system response regulator HydG
MEQHLSKNIADKPLKEVSGKAEYEIIEKILKQVNFNKTKAASLLNIDRRTLYNKLRFFKTLGVSRDQ